MGALHSHYIMTLCSNSLNSRLSDVDDHFGRVYHTDILPLPYLTLPYGEDVLPPSAEASNGPNAHPRINRKVIKSPSASPGSIPTLGTIPLPSEGLLT